MSFQARYYGRCAACNGGIHVGDECYYDYDEVVHATCGPTRPKLVVEKVCPICSMTSCDCGSET